MNYHNSCVYLLTSFVIVIYNDDIEKPLFVYTIYCIFIPIIKMTSHPNTLLILLSPIPLAHPHVNFYYHHYQYTDLSHKDNHIHHHYQYFGYSSIYTPN